MGCLTHHVQDGLLPLKQTVRHLLEPPLPLHVDVVGPVHHHLGGGDAPSCSGAPVAARSHPEKDSSMDLPDTRYAKMPDGVHIAYQVVGEGPVDLAYVSGWISNVD